jgi:hypothetical protein
LLNVCGASVHAVSKRSNNNVVLLWNLVPSRCAEFSPECLEAPTKLPAAELALEHSLRNWGQSGSCSAPEARLLHAASFHGLSRLILMVNSMILNQIEKDTVGKTVDFREIYQNRMATLLQADGLGLYPRDYADEGSTMFVLDCLREELSLLPVRPDVAVLIRTNHWFLKSYFGFSFERCCPSLAKCQCRCGCAECACCCESHRTHHGNKKLRPLTSPLVLDNLTCYARRFGLETWFSSVYQRDAPSSVSDSVKRSAVAPSSSSFQFEQKSDVKMSFKYEEGQGTLFLLFAAPYRTLLKLSRRRHMDPFFAQSAQFGDARLLESFSRPAKWTERKQPNPSTKANFDVNYLPIFTTSSRQLMVYDLLTSGRLPHLSSPPCVTELSIVQNLFFDLASHITESGAIQRTANDLKLVNLIREKLKRVKKENLDLQLNKFEREILLFWYEGDTFNELLVMTNQRIIRVDYSNEKADSHPTIEVFMDEISSVENINAILYPVAAEREQLFPPNCYNVLLFVIDTEDQSAEKKIYVPIYSTAAAYFIQTSVTRLLNLSDSFHRLVRSSASLRSRHSISKKKKKDLDHSLYLFSIKFDSNLRDRIADATRNVVAESSITDLKSRELLQMVTLPHDPDERNKMLSLWSWNAPITIDFFSSLFFEGQHRSIIDKKLCCSYLRGRKYKCEIDCADVSILSS